MDWLAAANFSFKAFTVLVSLAAFSCCSCICFSCSGLMPCCFADSLCDFFRSKSSVFSSTWTGKPLTESNCLPFCESTTLYLPGSMPSEKYSPFLFVFSEYLRPLSVLYQSRVAPAMGWPCMSLQTPLTVPVACANTGGTHSAAIMANGNKIEKFLFILTSRRTIAIADFRLTHQARTGTARYGMGSVAPASWKARRRRAQLSQAP